MRLFWILDFGFWIEDLQTIGFRTWSWILNVIVGAENLKHVILSAAKNPCA